ncbi:MAG: NAD(P)/FAD-dependent oxidoreductase, partial [Mesorhizobium sp.]
MQIITPGMRLIPEAVLANNAALFRTIPETPSHRDKSLHRVVIVGGGAGGLELATRLGRKFGKGRLSVTLVDR